MSGLLGMLSLAARSLDAQRYGLDVVGQNIANVNTAGYTKRVTELAAMPATDRWSAGGGVEIVGARAMRDRLIDRRVREEFSAQQRDSAVSQQLGVVEVAVGQAGASLDAALDDFFDAFARLADTPISASAREEVVQQGQALASAFGDVATRLTSAQRDVDLQVRASVEQVNAIASRIASLNAKLAGTSPSTPEGAHLRDEVNRAVEELAGLVGLNTIEREHGGFDIETVSGRPLVIGERAYPLGLTEDAQGLAQITSSDGTVITGGISSGALGGLLNVRDRHLPDYLARLDQLAFDVAQGVNTLHQTGYDLNGNTGTAFYAPVALQGAASSMAVNPLLTAAGGGSLVAASGTSGVAGDTAIARALAKLREAPVSNGGSATAAEAWSQIVYRVGRDRDDARAGEATQAQVLRQIQNLQDAVSGVSLDEEAADMMRFQRAYEANARFFTTIDEVLDTLIAMVR